MSPIAGPLARLLPAADPRSDGDLLAAFLAHRDEAAFAELVRRHGSAVRAACRRMLPDPADADDAFQAAFLVLVRRGHSLDPAHPLGPWLYRVAVLTARTLRRGNARRFAHREAPPAEPAAPEGVTDLRLDLDAALLALPEKYRTPLVLCHLEGWSRRDAAERLGCREGTLSSLLARGLAKLKARLRGYDPTAALAAGAVPVPVALAAATARAAVGVGRSPAAVLLAASVVHGFRLVRLAGAAGVAVVLAAAGYGVVAASRPADPTSAAVVAPPAARSPDPLPTPGPPPAVPTKRIDVCVGGPLGGVPLRATENDAAGPTGGPVYFTGIDRFEHYLAAARTVGPAPPKVRVDVWDGAPPDRTRAVFRAVRGAGYNAVTVRGRVPTLTGGWREFDDDAVDLADLAPPRPAAAPATGCAINPNPCRAPATDA